MRAKETFYYKMAKFCFWIGRKFYRLADFFTKKFENEYMNGDL